MNPEQNIHINVSPRYLDNQSRPEENRFVFSYTITISNNGTHSAQLISRRWHITDADGQVQEVSGIGVVGETPLIEAGDHYTYTSGAMLETPTGTMEGAYQMRDHNGEMFEVTIPTFALVPPKMLH